LITFGQGQWYFPFSDPEIKMRIANSLEQAARGELTTLPKEDINKFLGV